MSEQNSPGDIHDHGHAPEIFTSGASGFFCYENNLVITLESPRIDHSVTPGALTRVVVGRIVLPMAAAQALVMNLGVFLEQQRTESHAHSDAARNRH